MWSDCMLSLCVCEVYVKFVCVCMWVYVRWEMVCDKVVCMCECVWSYCMLNLCVCVKLLYVEAGGRREEEEPGIQNQKQEPHTKL